MTDQPMAGSKYAAYAAAERYFALVRGALGDRVDGEHCFDAVSDDLAYEVLYDFPGWPRIVRGRTDLMHRSPAMAKPSSSTRPTS